MRRGTRGSQKFTYLIMSQGSSCAFSSLTLSDLFISPHAFKRPAAYICMSKGQNRGHPHTKYLEEKTTTEKR